MAGDAHYASVSLLLHGDGANGSTTFTDNSPTPKTVTAYGNAQISTAQSKSGGASMKFDGTGDYLRSTSANVLPANELFTIEGWVYQYSTTGYQTLVSGESAGTLVISCNAGTAVTINPYGTSGLGFSSTLTGNTWHHLAVVRNASSNVLAFVNGILVGTQASPSFTAATVARIGEASAGLQGWNGYIDDLRITRGVARYSADFTPPASAFANYAGEVAGTVYDDTGAPCARTVRIHNRSTGALISGATSDAGTGAYLLTAPTLDEVQRIVLDDSDGTLYNDIIDRVIPA